MHQCANADERNCWGRGCSLSPSRGLTFGTSIQSMAWTHQGLPVEVNHTLISEGLANTATPNTILQQFHLNPATCRKHTDNNTLPNSAALSSLSHQHTAPFPQSKQRFQGIFNLLSFMFHNQPPICSSLLTDLVIVLSDRHGSGSGSGSVVSEPWNNWKL